MSCLLKICALIAFMLLVDTVQTSPLFQGFSVQKGFEVKFKPFEFKPFAFFKEKWSPFGRFGIRKGIQKRDLMAETMEKLSPRPEIVPPAPVFEFPEENKPEYREENERAFNELQPRPDPISVKPISSNLIRIPLERVKSSTEVLHTRIGNPPVPITPKPIEALFGELPPRPIGPVPERVPVSPQPIQPISHIPVPFQPATPIPNVFPQRPPNVLESRPVIPVLFQPMQSPGPAQSEVSGVPLITPPPPPIRPVPVAPDAPLSEIPPTDGPLVRGSKVALYFGNVLLQLVSQFLTNARKQITQYKQSSTLPPIPSPFVSGGNK